MVTGFDVEPAQFPRPQVHTTNEAAIRCRTTGSRSLSVPTDEMAARIPRTTVNAVPIAACVFPCSSWLATVPKAKSTPLRSRRNCNDGRAAIETGAIAPAGIRSPTRRAIRSSATARTSSIATPSSRLIGGISTTLNCLRWRRVAAPRLCSPWRRNSAEVGGRHPCRRTSQSRPQEDRQLCGRQRPHRGRVRGTGCGGPASEHHAIQANNVFVICP